MIVIEAYKGQPVTEQRVEIVERKGIGHPDYMCDAIMEAVSVALCDEYLRSFGTVLHHNIDKGLLAAGRVNKTFGGGSVTQPMELIIGDRATFKVGAKEIPVPEIAIDAAKSWIRDHLRHVDPEEHLRYHVVLAPGSTELADIFLRSGEVKAANDTSAAVGYFPLSKTEQAVRRLENYLNSDAFKQAFPETGEDVKVMGLRTERQLDLTVAMPLLASDVRSETEYFERKAVIHQAIRDHVAALEDFSDIKVHYNTLDEPGRGLGGVYLSLLGTSAEEADSGQVGRGNRVNGLISINRPLGTEAAAGKNPVSHVGKIYNVLSHEIAKEIYESIEGISEVYILMLSRIGVPIDQPSMASAHLVLQPGLQLADVTARAQEIIERRLANISSFCLELSRGKYPVC